MAGKEFKARSRTVSKMSRDGLMEEDLGTGKTRRAVTGRADAVRIGDRPMERLPDTGGMTDGSPGEGGTHVRHRMDYSGSLQDMDARPGAAGTGEQPESHAGTGNRKRIAKAGEPSFSEAPSSLEETESMDRTHSRGGDSGGSLADHAAPGEFRQDTYHTALRQGRGKSPYSPGGTETGKGQLYGDGRTAAGPEGNLGSPRAEDTVYRDSSLPDGPGRGSRRRLQERYNRNRKEKTERTEVSDPGNRDSGITDPLAEGTGHKARAYGDGISVTAEDGSGKSPSEESVQDAAAEHSRYVQQIRGHPSSGTREAALYSGGIGSGERSRPYGKAPEESTAGKGRLREDSSELDGLDSFRDEILTKQKKQRLNQEHHRSRDPTRLSFDDESGMVKGSGTGFSRRAGTARGTAAGMAGAAGSAVAKAASLSTAAAHAKASEAIAEDDNAGTQAAHHTEMAAESSARALASRAGRMSGRKTVASRRKADGRGVQRLQFTEVEDIKASAGAVKSQKEKKAAAKKFFQKQRQRRIYAAAKKEEKTIEAAFRAEQGFVSKAASIVRDAIVKNSRAVLTVGTVLLIFLLSAASIASCAALIEGAGSSVVSTTYPSTDEDIYAVENRYRELEAGLDAQVRRMQETHPTYDEFRFQIDEISHNPYHLISYFTAKYGQFTYEQVKDELEEIFREQYSLTTTGERGITITETRTVRPGDSLGQVTTSGYCPCEICCGPYAGGPTASGTYPVSDHTIAVDADNPFVPLGTHVIMNGTEYVVEDTGAFDRYGVQFDVYYDYHESALAHGHQVWEAVLAEGGGIEELELTTTRTVDRLSVVLTNHDLDTVLQNRMTEAEKVRYTLYNITYGNRNYLFDLNSLPKYGPASRDYIIPPEALSDERFARMIAEAEKHLGTPYVWGGYSPSGFDCSGFVCWVINHCGNGWDIGRTTAEGIRRQCYYVSPEDAKPGDIVFFEHTYETAGASHVGIYVGDGMMIHSGEPCQYTSIRTPYWQEHLMEFGRLP